MKDINNCIESQNFERAAKIRDVYSNLHKFTEKQTVILDTFIDGIVAKIVQIESQWVVIVLVFQQWKLVDVIRTKESTDEVDKDQLILWLELEFGDCVKKSDQHNQIMLSSHGMKLTKQVILELEIHFDQFIASYIASGAWQKDSIVADLLKWLQQRYDFAYYPLRIECLDISHFAGDRASGGLSAMDGGIANKKWYRRYKIKKATWGDDYGSLKEVIIRRFGQRHVIARNEAERNDEAISNDIDQIATSEQSWFPASSQWRDFLPDLFVLDGAEKQLEVVKKLLESWTIDKELLNKVQFASLGKGDARKSWQKIKGEKEKLYVLKAKEQKGEKAKTIDGVMLWIVDYEFQYDEVDRVLLRLRDEAHRFANSYREKQQSMELTTKKTIKK